MSTPNPYTIGFFLAANATPEHVELVIADIRSYFGLEDEGEGVAPTAVAAAQAGTPELDSAGVPWDERIHSGSKGKNKDNTWKKLKNVDPAYHAKITAELKAAAATTTASPSLPNSQPSLPQLNATTTVPALPQLNPYQTLMRDVGALVEKNVINDEWLNQIAAYVGVQGGFVNLAATQPEVVLKAREAINQALNGSGYSI